MGILQYITVIAIVTVRNHLQRLPMQSQITEPLCAKKGSYVFASNYGQTVNFTFFTSL